MTPRIHAVAFAVTVALGGGVGLADRYDRVEAGVEAPGLFERILSRLADEPAAAPAPIAAPPVIAEPSGVVPVAAAVMPGTRPVPRPEGATLRLASAVPLAVSSSIRPRPRPVAYAPVLAAAAPALRVLPPVDAAPIPVEVLPGAGGGSGNVAVLTQNGRRTVIASRATDPVPVRVFRQGSAVDVLREMPLPLEIIDALR